jgi:CBS-domain-containing membrane protein
MRVRDVMTQDVVSVGPDDSILRAVHLMLQKKVSGLPVVDAAGKLVGIVSEGDFLRRAELGTAHRQPKWLEFLMGPGLLAQEFTRASGRKVREVMATELRTVEADASVADAVDCMERYRVKRLPVMDKGGMVGIVTRSNLLRALAGLIHDKPVAAGDSEIKERLLAELKKKAWAPIVTVDVHQGVVELSGILSDERQREAVRVVVENTLGVKSIVDHLVWVEPLSGTVIESKEDQTAAAKR